MHSSTCNHKWVDYQPFQGEPYKCCANAGCGVRFDDLLSKLEEETKKTTYTLPAGWGDYFVNDKGEITYKGTADSNGATSGKALIKLSEMAAWLPFQFPKDTDDTIIKSQNDDYTYTFNYQFCAGEILKRTGNGSK